MSSVSSDAEISPPLYFILAWLSTKLGSAPELVRLPSLIAGTVSIPLVYLVGARAVSRPAGLIAAAVMALSPFMIFYSADGRGYAVAIALLLGSTLAMLAGARDGRTRWWVLYGLLSLLAMYTHYTSAFVLIAQLVWLLWAHPGREAAGAARQCRRRRPLPALGPGPAGRPELADHRHPLGAPGGRFRRQAPSRRGMGGRLSVQDPASVPRRFPGRPRARRHRDRRRGRARPAPSRPCGRPRSSPRGRPVPLVSRGMALVFALAVATGFFEVVLLLLTGNDLLGARNLVTSSAGLALLIGAVLASAGRIWGRIATVLVHRVLRDRRGDDARDGERTRRLQVGGGLHRRRSRRPTTWWSTCSRRD